MWKTKATGPDPAWPPAWHRALRLRASRPRKAFACPILTRDLRISIWMEGVLTERQRGVRPQNGPFRPHRPRFRVPTDPPFGGAFSQDKTTLSGGHAHPRSGTAPCVSDIPQSPRSGPHPSPATRLRPPRDRAERCGCPVRQVGPEKASEMGRAPLGGCPFPCSDGGKQASCGAGMRVHVDKCFPQVDGEKRLREN